MRSFSILLFAFLLFSCSKEYDYEFEISTLDFETKEVKPNMSFFIIDKYDKVIHTGVTNNSGFAKVNFDVNSTYEIIYLTSQDYNLQLTENRSYPESFKIVTPTTKKTILYLEPK